MLAKQVQSRNHQTMNIYRKNRSNWAYTFALQMKVNVFSEGCKFLFRIRFDGIMTGDAHINSWSSPYRAIFCFQAIFPTEKLDTPAPYSCVRNNQMWILQHGIVNQIPAASVA